MILPSPTHRTNAFLEELAKLFVEIAAEANLDSAPLLNFCSAKECSIDRNKLYANVAR